jgi:ribonuclease H2 subunit C
MKGCELALPDGFGGAVLERREDVGGDTADEPMTSWHATDTFSSFTYWNHDTAPVKTDSIRRAMEWAALSSHIHQPVSAEQVDEEIKKAAAATEIKLPLSG